MDAKPGTACSLALGLGKAKPNRALKGSPHTLYAGRGGLSDPSKDAALSPRSPSLLPHDQAWVGSRTCRPQRHQSPASPPPLRPPSIGIKNSGPATSPSHSPKRWPGGTRQTKEVLSIPVDVTSRDGQEPQQHPGDKAVQHHTAGL